VHFTKMHGAGNDYVFVDVSREPVENPADLARIISDRHFGIGSDGLILIEPSAEADVGMRVFNADGSEAEMCGNGVRCVAKYAYEHALCRKSEVTVQTKAGVRTVKLIVEDGVVTGGTVNMGRPRLRRSEIPMLGPDAERVVDEELRVGREALRVTCVSMGNPHCIVPGIWPRESRIIPPFRSERMFTSWRSSHGARCASPRGREGAARPWPAALARRRCAWRWSCWGARAGRSLRIYRGETSGWNGPSRTDAST